ncbi:MAG: alpha/beta hydrolase [Candidatus Thorarchaeota archaeon]
MNFQRVEFTVGDDQIEGILSTPNLPFKDVALLLHPHPLYGGNRDDRVIRFADDVLLDLGYTTFRFNFRGVGSQADYRGFSGAIQDAIGASKALLHKTNRDSLAIVGYSFGGSVALHLASSAKADFLVTFSASLDLAKEATSGLEPLSDIQCPALMFHGTNDNMVPFDDMRTLAKILGRSDVQAVALKGEGHFYLTHLDSIGTYLREFLKETAED